MLRARDHAGESLLPVPDDDEYGDGDAPDEPTRRGRDGMACSVEGIGTVPDDVAPLLAAHADGLRRIITDPSPDTSTTADANLQLLSAEHHRAKHQTH